MKVIFGTVTKTEILNIKIIFIIFQFYSFYYNFVKLFLLTKIIPNNYYELPK